MIRILFICGSLEAGKDGVGDYVRRLAEALRGLGVVTSALAFHDRNTEEVISSGSRGESFACLRIPTSFDDEKRFMMAKTWIEENEPHWLSLQFVPFAFHPRGLSYGLGSVLSKLGKGRKWHLMFHELWVGMGSDSSLRQRVWGKAQKRIIMNLIHDLAPALVTTQAKVYTRQLATMSVLAEYLPLFSNIPVLSTREQSVDPSALRLVLFGSAHHGAPVRSFVAEAAEYSKLTGRVVSVVLAGRNGSEASGWIATCEAFGLPVECAGEQSPARLSELIAGARAGIATTPLALLDKSGSVAAMRAHGLPVICVARHWEPLGIGPIFPLHDIFNYQTGNLAQFFNLLIAPPVLQTVQVEDVAKQFVEMLTFADG